MVTVAFGRWSDCAGRFFTLKRIYYKGYKWTPFCRIKKRYKSWFGYKKERPISKKEVKGDG